MEDILQQLVTILPSSGNILLAYSTGFVHDSQSSNHKQSNWRQNDKYWKYHKHVNKTKRQKKQSIKESCRIYPFLAKHGCLCVWYDLLGDDVYTPLNTTFKTRFSVWPRVISMWLCRFFWLHGLALTPYTLHGQHSGILSACNTHTDTGQTSFDLLDPTRHTTEWIDVVTI